MTRVGVLCLMISISENKNASAFHFIRSNVGAAYPFALFFSCYVMSASLDLSSFPMARLPVSHHHKNTRDAHFHYKSFHAVHGLFAVFCDTCTMNSVCVLIYMMAGVLRFVFILFRFVFDILEYIRIYCGQGRKEIFRVCHRY